MSPSASSPLHITFVPIFMSRSADPTPRPGQAVKEEDKSKKEDDKSVAEDKHHKKGDSLASRVKLKPFMSMPVVTEKKVEHQNLPNEPDKENKKDKLKKEGHDPKKEDKQAKKTSDKLKEKEPKEKDCQPEKKYGLFLDSDTPEEGKKASGEKKS